MWCSNARWNERKSKITNPIITPTTKAEVGHDEDISREEILSSGLINENDYTLLEKYTNYFKEVLKLQKMGLILVDTKYEFGKDSNGNITLIDEIHTPDSSDIFILDLTKKS